MLGNWTEYRIAQFRELYTEGKSHGEIAEQLGITRNASIGKAHRLGLDGRRTGPTSRAGRPPKPDHLRPWETAGVSKTTWYRWQNPALYDRKRYRTAVAIGDQATDLPLEPAADPVDFFNLEPHHCRWPVGGRGLAMLSCGAARAIFEPYCVWHCRIAYR